jgi:hypothetical protein
MEHFNLTMKAEKHTCPTYKKDKSLMQINKSKTSQFFLHKTIKPIDPCPVGVIIWHTKISLEELSIGLHCQKIP